MGKAIAWRDANEGSTIEIRRVAETTKASKEKILTDVNPDTDEVYSPESWVGAYWLASHEAKTGDAGLVFMIFADEIVDKLKNYAPSLAKVIRVYGTQYGEWAAPEHESWYGEQATIRVVMRLVSGVQRLVIEMKCSSRGQSGWHYLGIVAADCVPYLLPGHTRDVKIYSQKFSAGKTSSVKLFDMSMSDDDIYDYLNSH